MARVLSPEDYGITGATPSIGRRENGFQLRHIIDGYNFWREPKNNNS